ncbi:MAG: AIPR family protein, partial [Anaerolineae bacterium]|nr:AIPR family protein [Anaerolineae bacterium]
MMHQIDLTYPTILTSIDRYLVGDRTDSSAFLIWFLENYYRLDEVEAQDSVCDGNFDMGVDAIYVDDNLERIDVFQAKIYQRQDKTIGDTSLKEIVGTLSQFVDPQSVNSLISATSNAELKALLIDKKVSEKISDGYQVFGIYVTNAMADASADAYTNGNPNLRVYDRKILEDQFISTDPTGSIGTSISFSIVPNQGHVYYETPDAKAVIASIAAKELVEMEGIKNQVLFSWNVRQALGRTKINKEIQRSIVQKDDHHNFLLYHNGLTILCESLEVNNLEITISGYSVVNGCQSLTTLFENRDKLSDNLRILSRIVEVSPDSKIAQDITYNTNNQNAIKARDFQSNSTIQRRLQAEFVQEYPNITYTIKRGGNVDGIEIDNSLAAQILLAFDVQEPWTCHQTYRLFGDLHDRIFRGPEITAHRIYALYTIFEVVTEKINDLDNQRMANYSLTNFFLLYLIRLALETDTSGKLFCQNPHPFISSVDGHNRLQDCIRSILQDLLIDLNHELRERDEAGNTFDYKRELKSPNAVRSIARSIVAGYEKQVARGRIPAFSDQWEDSATDPD